MAAISPSSGYLPNLATPKETVMATPTDETKAATRGGKCPFPHGARDPMRAGSRGNAAWWPEQLKIGMQHLHSTGCSPMDAVER